MPKISVLMPVYNTKEEYLRAAIESILAQTFTDFELIIVNDGSTNNAEQVIKSYFDPRIKYFKNEKNLGQSCARNKGLDNAGGNYIAFVDSDDFIHVQFLEILFKTAQITKASIVALDTFNQLSKRGVFSTLIDTNRIEYSLHNEPVEHLMSNIWSSSVIWNKLYTKEILKDKRFIEDICFEDWPFVTCLFAKIKGYTTIPYPLYTYNDTSPSIMRSTFTCKKINDYAKGIEYVYAFFNKNKNKQRLVQKRRITASIQMMINMTKREQKEQQKLIRHLFNVLKYLHSQKVFYIKDLPIKFIIRLIKLWLKLL